jgi:hypothetical protein
LRFGAALRAMGFDAFFATVLVLAFAGAFFAVFFTDFLAIQ